MKRRFYSLTARHRALDARIDASRSVRDHSPDIAHLKRMRLAIKDEIQGLHNAGSRPAA
ncbi:YdcH family protein [Parasphingopyxis sp.]|uniref:YdcH family protein n=1 Tax=Parasphingopyxis sp. TaxID=1920299 RepID=UPI00260473E0|nr:YdcH family protein [Parasphingopyxis sp.]